MCASEFARRFVRDLLSEMHFECQFDLQYVYVSGFSTASEIVFVIASK